MTARELYQLALSRNRTLRANRHAFTHKAFRRWLESQTAAGLLVKRDRRYYLTEEGWWIAQALAGQPIGIV